MEPIISKLQEGVKYPRFERDATKTINDLVDHITKERGVYSSSIEPNPSEHSVWFNTNNNTLYIYNDDTWATVSDKNVHISEKGEEFLPYPVINILNSTSYIGEWYIEENKHYVIIISANNIKEYLNYIVDYNEERQFIIIGDDTNTSGTFLVNIYDTYIYYIKLSSSHIKEDNVFYCSGGNLYYSGNNTSNYNDPIYIEGFYTEKRLKNEIESFEGDTTENINLNGIFIEPESDSTIIIGKQDFVSEITILGEHVDFINIYMYNNKLQIGSNNDNVANTNYIAWNEAYIYCNCKEIRDIFITHSGSSLNLSLYDITFIVGNNNKLNIEDSTIMNNIDDCYIYVIKENDNDKSSVYLEKEDMLGSIVEYVNLCGTKLTGSGGSLLKCKTFITTTIDDIDGSVSGSVINYGNCELIIIDAPYREISNPEIIRNLPLSGVYVTDETLQERLWLDYNHQTYLVIRNIAYNNNYVNVQYINPDNGKSVYNKIIYKQ